MPASYLSPKTRIGESHIEGRGLFACSRIRKGEIVAIKGGHVYDARTLAKVKGHVAVSYIQIADRFFIGALTAAEVARNKIFINHSCEPNLGIRGQIMYIALRDIMAGEELTYDWAMEANSSDRTRCRCGTRRCDACLLDATGRFRGCSAGIVATSRPTSRIRFGMPSVEEYAPLQGAKRASHASRAPGNDDRKRAAEFSTRTGTRPRPGGSRAPLKATPDDEAVRHRRRGPLLKSRPLDPPLKP
jgi:hypothetical protein